MKPILELPSLAGSEVIQTVWVLKLMHFWKPSLGKSIRNYKCNISRDSCRTLEGAEES